MSEQNDQAESEVSTEVSGNNISSGGTSPNSQNVSIDTTIGNNQQPDAHIVAEEQSMPVVDGVPGVASFGVEEIDLDTVDAVEEVEVSAEKPTDKAFIPLNAELTKDYRKPIPKVDPNFEYAIFPAGDLDEIEEMSEAAPNIDTETLSVKEWLQALQAGFYASPQNRVYLDKIRSDKAAWKQFLQVNEKTKLAPAAPAYAINSHATILSGEDALRRIHSSIGLGTYLQIPLYGSGFWLTLKAPETDTLLELNRQIAESKIALGRRTYGTILGNNSVYIVNIMVAFIKSHIYAHTIANATTIDISDYIKSTDYPALLWGMACLIWKNGFQYEQACIQSPEICSHVISALIDVSKLLWVDNNAFTENQKAHMAKRAGSTMSLDAIKLYVDQFPFNSAQRFTIGKDKVTEGSIDVELAVPSITEYINAGMEWVGKIVFFVDKVMNDDAPETRMAHYMSHAKATRMRQYTQWVSKIYAGEHLIENKDDIAKALDIYSNDDDMTKAFIDGVSKYITDSTVAVFGIPHTECPNCKKARTTMEGNFTSLVPVDIMQTFFTLLGPKVSRIEQREF